ncbi:TetR/AcrR family transcriptional regulator [Algoriphagus sp. AGSA1]|uniref:TetR/AcrR family transcriptional regulator n=1 Tax=Algoriphagus sp. AGSA1 TaxID=2907213 RepID=UPI001F276420|nr:TetR/AcrR family transcriptional regulator [Algoriphagus sp. AGSA1]MCE7057217.1 TetR/AcrR family transcriptional regulator [Algoriphagus sp. AGSA1]
MRPQKVLDGDLMNGLAKVFRSLGYEGASLQELSVETGLKKASLYHRFPNGKQEMAESVLLHFDQWVKNNVFSALSDEKHDPIIRLKLGLEQIRLLYEGGNQMCVFRTLSMDKGLQLFENNLQEGIQQWINAFVNIGLAFHLSLEKAEQLAIQNMIDIQGSLVLSRIMKDKTIFENALKNIEERYIT